MHRMHAYIVQYLTLALQGVLARHRLTLGAVAVAVTLPVGSYQQYLLISHESAASKGRKVLADSSPVVSAAHQGALPTFPGTFPGAPPLPTPI